MTNSLAVLSHKCNICILCSTTIIGQGIQLLLSQHPVLRATSIHNFGQPFLCMKIRQPNPQKATACLGQNVQRANTILPSSPVTCLLFAQFAQLVMSLSFSLLGRADSYPGKTPQIFIFFCEHINMSYVASMILDFLFFATCCHHFT